MCDPQGQRGWGAWEEGGLGLGPAKGTEGAFRGEEGPGPRGGVSTMPPEAARGPVSLPRALAREHADTPAPAPALFPQPNIGRLGLPHGPSGEKVAVVTLDDCDTAVAVRFGSLVGNYSCAAQGTQSGSKK